MLSILAQHIAHFVQKVCGGVARQRTTVQCGFHVRRNDVGLVAATQTGGHDCVVGDCVQFSRESLIVDEALQRHIVQCVHFEPCPQRDALAAANPIGNATDVRAGSVGGAHGQPGARKFVYCAREMNNGIVGMRHAGMAGFAMRQHAHPHIALLGSLNGIETSATHIHTRAAELAEGVFGAQQIGVFVHQNANAQIGVGLFVGGRGEDDVAVWHTGIGLAAARPLRPSAETQPTAWR